MDGLLEAKSELKWKFLLRTVHAAGAFKLCSFYGQSANVPPAQAVPITAIYSTRLPEWDVCS